MIELGWWSKHVKPALNRPANRWAAWKVQDIYNRGLPDALVCCVGRVALLELKLVELPKRASTLVKIDLSLEQERHLAVWGEAGGRGLVLLGTQCKAWALLTPQEVTECGRVASWVAWQQKSLLGGHWRALPEIGSWLARQ